MEARLHGPKLLLGASGSEEEEVLAFVVQGCWAERAAGRMLKSSGGRRLSGTHRRTTERRCGRHGSTHATACVAASTSQWVAEIEIARQSTIGFNMFGPRKQFELYESCSISRMRGMGMAFAFQ